jgi:hypothetical protein
VWVAIISVTIFCILTTVVINGITNGASDNAAKSLLEFRDTVDVAGVIIIVLLLIVGLGRRRRL